MKKVLITALCIVLAIAALVLGLKRHRSNSDLQKTLDIELAATPTATADIGSTLLNPVSSGRTSSATSYLKVGSKGDRVTEVQKRLGELGYYQGECDGQFGQGTEAAVIRFQDLNGLSADGIVGDSTYQKLFSANAIPCTAAVTETPAPSPTASAGSTGLLKKGDKGDEVKKMQNRLKELGYLEGEADGHFGPATEEALLTFQRQNGLEADGIAAAKTFAALYDENAPRIVVTPTPDPAQMPILVNRTHPISDSYKPSSLVKLKNVLPSSLCTVKGSDIEGSKIAVDALQQMLEAAQKDGIKNWQINAGYRSISYQQKLFDKSVKEFMEQGFTRSKAETATRQTVADPGTSEHHTGLAFDITAKDATQFKDTEQQKWLHKHCWDYGFIVRYQEDKEKITGYLAECWHIRYVGLPHSQTMHDKNLCLEEYLGILD